MIWKTITITFYSILIDTCSSPHFCVMIIMGVLIDEPSEISGRQPYHAKSLSNGHESGHGVGYK